MTNIAQANEKTSKCHATHWSSTMLTGNSTGITQNLRACRGRADRRRPCSCATRGRRGLQGQTRTHPAAAPHGVRLELPTAHHRQKLARLYSRYARAWQLWKPKMLNCERP